LNQKKAKQFVRNRLYLVDSLFVRSEEEAATLAASCRVSARALIMRAEAKSALPAEAWSGFYRALDEQDARLSGKWREELRESMRALGRHNRLAIGSLILVLALVFFTLVPAGRAIAESIFHYVITVFDKQLQIDQIEEKRLYEERGYDVPEEMIGVEPQLDENGEVKIISDPVYYDTIAEFEAVYQLDAFELVSDALTCVEIFEVDHLFTGKSLRSNYLTADGKTVTVLESWYQGDGMSVGTRGEIKEKTVLGDRTMTYVVDAANGSFDGFVLLDHSVLTIYADEGVDLNLIWELLS
jgi:hypothetical protein